MKQTKAIFIAKLQRLILNPWVGAAFVASLLVATPVLIIFPEVLASSDEVWSHIVRNLLPAYVQNTIWLMLGVAVLTFLLGVSTAWFVSMYHFAGRRFFEWALILPIAIPGYINGFTWAGMLDFTSPVYVWLRSTFGINTGPYLYFDILSLPGAIFILSVSLYPYVYLIARTWFMRQSHTLIEASASLGRSPFNTFFSTALPLARPAIVAGVSLVLMEVLNDYGLVRYYEVHTFTTGIFKAWFSFGNPQAAMRLSAFLMVLVLGLIWLERYQRGSMRFDQTSGNFKPAKVYRLRGLWSAFAFVICMLPLLAGFLLPAAMLIWWSLQTAASVVDQRFWALLQNSFLLAGTASLLVVGIAVLVAYAVRSFPNRVVKLLARIATLGYALPGAVVAIGIMVAFMWFDSQAIMMLLTGTWAVLIYAYAVRFMAVGYNSIDAGMARLSPSLDEASRSLGRSGSKTLTTVVLPLIKGPLLSAALLVFIDVLKELPLTLILRPFNFDTLAIRAFEFASDERIAQAAPAALIIILVGLVPVYILNRMLIRETR